MISSLDEHLGYVADSIRLNLFKAAVAHIIEPRVRVADLGCGSGILGLLCLQAGADHIYAIDSSTMIRVARESLKRAGYSDRVTFFHGKSSQIELPEPVDVVICDHVGYFGFDYGIVGLIQDARTRFLKPGGTLIPSKIRLYAAAVGSQKCFDLVNGWQAENICDAFRWLRNYAVNTKYAVNLTPDEILGSPAILGDMDLYEKQPDYHSWDIEIVCRRAGVIHGLAGWFECELAPNVSMTNSPLAENSIRRSQAYLPIAEALNVNEGETIQATVMVRPSDHVIAWSVAAPATGQRFAHSTWEGELLTREQIMLRNPAHRPRLTPKGRATAVILGYCDDRRTASQIEQSVLRDHPNLFPSKEEIVRFVAQILGGYAE